MEQIDRLQQQVDKNQTKLNQLEKTVSNMCGSCTERHKIDLISEIKVLDKEEKSFKQTTEKKEAEIQQDIKQNIDKIDGYTEKYYEQKAEFTQMKNRILTLQEDLRKKQNLKDQIFTAVVIFIILQFLTLFIFKNISSFSQSNIEIDKADIIQQVQNQ